MHHLEPIRHGSSEPRRFLLRLVQLAHDQEAARGKREGNSGNRTQAALAALRGIVGRTPTSFGPALETVCRGWWPTARRQSVGTLGRVHVWYATVVMPLPEDPTEPVTNRRVPSPLSAIATGE
jgi:hypothetical protein